MDDTMGPPDHRGRCSTLWSRRLYHGAPPILAVVLVEDGACAGHRLGGLRRLPAVEDLLHLRAGRRRAQRPLDPR